MRPRILIECSSRGWAFENIARQLSTRLPNFDFTIKTLLETEPSSWDLTVVMYWHEFDRIRSMIHSDRYVLCVYDHMSWAGKYRPMFLRAASQANLIVVGNEKVAEEMRAAGCSTPIVVCPDGVDPQLFPVMVTPKQFTMGWTGRADNRDNDHKGLELIRSACKKAQVPLVEQHYQNRVTQDKMAKSFYKRISCYCCASLNEGGPNPVLEALACGRPVISTDVGIVDQVIDGTNGIIVERSVDAITEAINEIKKKTFNRQATRQSARDFFWDRRAEQWGEAIELALSPQCEILHAPPPDPNELVTCFMMTIGDEPHLKLAKAALAKQTMAFKIEMVDHVAPASKALQAMIDRCKTPFFIQVDEDMVLKPNTVERMLKIIQAEPDSTAMICGALHDGSADRNIYGVKMYRHKAARIVRVSNESSCDIGHNGRLQALGYKIKTLPLNDTMGEHCPNPTAEQLYKRWYRLLQKQRQYGKLAWVEEYPVKLLERWRASRTTKDLYAALGAAVGIMENDVVSQEDDYRVPLPALEMLKKYWPMDNGVSVKGELRA